MFNQRDSFMNTLFKERPSRDDGDVSGDKMKGFHFIVLLHEQNRGKRGCGEKKIKKKIHGINCSSLLLTRQV